MGAARSGQKSVFQPPHRQYRSTTKEPDHPRGDDRGDKDRQAQHDHPRVTTVGDTMAGWHRTVIALVPRHGVVNYAGAVVHDSQ
jgi:hypothetical protein